MGKALAQIFLSYSYLKIAPDFIRENKLWRGYLKSGWLAKMSIILAVIFAFIFLNNVYDGFSTYFGEQNAEHTMGLASLGNHVFYDGFSKYLLLIILEMLIFFFSVKTLNILDNTDIQPTKDEFIGAQKRMIKVSLRNYIYEMILKFLISTVLSIVFLGFLKHIFFLLLEFYFLGYGFMDNYFEQKKMNVKEAQPFIFKHKYATMTIGAVAYLLFLFPLIGAIVAPFICAVAACCYLHDVNKEEDFKVIAPVVVLDGEIE